MTTTFKNFLGVAAIGLCMNVAASAQTITGSVSGVVTDPSGAVIPGAKVAATNVDTGVTVTDTSNSAGIYNIRFLQIGRYKVTTKANGFSTQTYGPFSLEIDQVAKVDVALKIGQSNETVQVDMEAQPILNTENATLGETFTENTINSIHTWGGFDGLWCIRRPGIDGTRHRWQHGGERERQPCAIEQLHPGRTRDQREPEQHHRIHPQPRLTRSDSGHLVERERRVWQRERRGYRDGH
jgi:hypothetical protein